MHPRHGACLRSASLLKIAISRFSASTDRVLRIGAKTVFCQHRSKLSAGGSRTWSIDGGIRVLADIPVQLRCRTGKFVDAHLVNLSISDALIRTEMMLPPLTPLEVKLKDCIVPSFVVRIANDGIGIEWFERSPRMFAIALLAEFMTAKEPPAPIEEATA